MTKPKKALAWIVLAPFVCGGVLLVLFLSPLIILIWAFNVVSE